MINIAINGVSYPVPSSAADVNWAASQVAFEQALAAAIDANTTDIAELDNVTWATLSLLNGWANVSGGAPAASYIDPFRVAHVRFEVDSGTPGAGTPVATMPSGQRPPYALKYVANCNDNSGFVVITIATNGNVSIEPLGAADPGAGGVTFEASFSVVANP